MQTRKEIISKIKPYLKKEMLAKLDKNAKWTYISIPEGKEKSDISAKISNFIENKLDHFIQLCQDVFPYFSQVDSESIGTVYPTEIAKKFIGLFHYLEDNGFPGPRAFNKPVSFWSGEAAKKKALEISTELSDSKVPSVSAMFDVCRAIHTVQQKYDNYIILLTSALSRVFSSYALGIANIYISSEKLSESPGLTVPNNFWLAELPTVMSLHERGFISDIKINLYNNFKQRWNKPVSLFTQEGNNIPIRRRNIHPFDVKESADRFKTPHMSAKERKQWYSSEPRPFITYGSLKRIAHEWRERTKQNRLVESNTHEIKDNKAVTTAL